MFCVTDESELSGDKEEAASIPGLDWSQDQAILKEQAMKQRIDSMNMKKVPYARPIPRSFEKAWLGQESPSTTVESSKCPLCGWDRSLSPPQNQVYSLMRPTLDDATCDSVQV
jgi:hypothetical protein